MAADMSSSSSPAARHSFTCVRCNNEAGRVYLFIGGELIRDSFTSRLTFRVDVEDFERIRGIILAGDIKALYGFNLEIASFYCPGCNACYCEDHWVKWDVFDDDEGFTWHDSIRGRCPLGHERMLED